MNLPKGLTLIQFGAKFYTLALRYEVSNPKDFIYILGSLSSNDDERRTTKLWNGMILVRCPKCMEARK